MNASRVGFCNFSIFNFKDFCSNGHENVSVGNECTHERSEISVSDRRAFVNKQFVLVRSIVSFVFVARA